MTIATRKKTEPQLWFWFISKTWDYNSKSLGENAANDEKFWDLPLDKMAAIWADDTFKWIFLNEKCLWDPI